MKVNIQLFEDGLLPCKATDNACCYDVFAREMTYVNTNYVIVKIGFAMSFPKNYKLVLVPRSNITKSGWFVPNSPGQGDSDYYNEYEIRFRALPNGIKFNWDKFKFELTYPEFPYKLHHRVGQIYLAKVNDIEFETVQEIKKSTNRTGGFGSTGK
mgnify:CR=1 FL=1